MRSVRRAIYIPFDHLGRAHGALGNPQIKADPSTDLIVMIESARMTTGRAWHPERLYFLISSARHFAQSLRDEGFTVLYEKAATTIDGLDAIKKLTEICNSSAPSHPRLDNTKLLKTTACAL